MKKQCSLLLLMVRGNVWKTMLILFAMIAAEAALLSLTLRGKLQSADLSEFSLESLISDSGIRWVFALAAALLLLALCRHGCSAGSQPGYTLSRLPVSHRTVFLWQSAAGCLSLALLWSVQALALLLFCRGLTAAPPEGVSFTQQSLFLACWQCPFLNALVPMENGLRWARNLLLVLSLGTASAAFPYRQRRHFTAQPILPLFALTLVLFATDLHAMPGDIFLILAAGGTMAWSLSPLVGKEARYEAP